MREKHALAQTRATLQGILIFLISLFLNWTASQLYGSDSLLISLATRLC